MFIRTTFWISDVMIRSWSCLGALSISAANPNSVRSTAVTESAAVSPPRPDLSEEFGLTEARSNLSKLMRVVSYRTVHILYETRHCVRINRGRINEVLLYHFVEWCCFAVIWKHIFHFHIQWNPDYTTLRGPRKAVVWSKNWEYSNDTQSWPPKKLIQTVWKTLWQEPRLLQGR